VTSIVLFSVIDCDTKQAITSVASDNTGTLPVNANDVYVVTIPDDATAWPVVVQGFGIGYETAYVTFTPAQNGTTQTVCLKKAPPPPPDSLAAPFGLQLVSYQNQTATFGWTNPVKYDKILFAWSVKAGTDVQATLPGNATNHAVSPIYPEVDYTITLEGGMSGLVASYYSHPPTTPTWHSPPGLWPLPATGALVPGHRVAAVARDPQQLDVFSVDRAGAVRTTFWHEGSPWSGLAGPLPSVGGAFSAGVPVTAISRTTDHLDLFVTDPHGVVETSYWQPGATWTAWRGIGGFFPVGAPVSAVAREPNRIDLFVTGNNGIVYTEGAVEGGEWSGVHNDWMNIGGTFPPGAPVAAVANNPFEIHLFIVDGDGHVYTSFSFLNHNWSGIGNKWTSLGGSFAPGAPVTVISRMPEHMDLFVTGTNGVVYTSYFQPNAPWTPWRPIGGFFPPNAPVAAASRVPNQIDLFVTGKDGVVYWQYGVQGAEWTGVNNNWANIGGIFPPGAPVAVTTRNSGQFDLFIGGNNGIIYTSSWYQGSDWSGKGNRWGPIGG